VLLLEGAESETPWVPASLTTNVLDSRGGNHAEPPSPSRSCLPAVQPVPGRITMRAHGAESLRNSCGDQFLAHTLGLRRDFLSHRPQCPGGQRTHEHVSQSIVVSPVAAQCVAAPPLVHLVVHRYAVVRWEGLPVLQRTPYRVVPGSANISYLGSHTGPASRNCLYPAKD